MAVRRRNSSRSKSLSMLNNKWLLYLLSIVAVGQLVAYGVDEKWESTVLFVVIGLLAHNYTKNMILVLLLAIVGTSILSIFIKFNEGFKEGIDGDEEDDDDEVEAMEDAEDEDESNTNMHVDKASTLTKNLKHIQKIVGKGGIQKMASETENLMNQQNLMIDNMAKLKPMTTEAINLINKLDNSNLVKTMATNKSKFESASKQLGGLKNIA
jgi:hypothetical protein